MAVLPAAKRKDPFTKRLDGVFGRFQTSESYPLYYVMTTFQTSDLENLVVAAKALPFNTIDFEELVQRDIDYERVDEEIVKEYLENGKNRVIFFPPLLVTPLIVEKDRPKAHYDKFEDSVTKDPSEDEYGQYEAIWDINKFKIELVLQKSDSGFQIQCQSDGSSHFFLNYGATLKYNPQSVKLVVIDGQHRLVALRRIIELGRSDLIKSAELPVCLFFSPTAIIGQPGSESLLKDMRELFVTINSKARTVSGHFLVLLNDVSLAARCVRSLANNWKKSAEDPAACYLHMLEWNQRQQSKANQVTRPYAITTVSIINECFSKYILNARNGAHTRVLLNLNEVSEALRHDGAPDYSIIDDESFAPSQLDILSNQIDKYVTPSLNILFSRPSPYKEHWERFTNAVNWLETRLSEVGARQFRDDVLFQFRSSQKNDQPCVKDMESAFNAKFKDYAPNRDFYRLNIFQQGLIRAWAEISEVLCPTHGVTPPQVAEALVAGFEKLCFSQSANLFDPKKDYTQNVFYTGVTLRVNETSKAQVANLILATLMHAPTRERTISILAEAISLNTSLALELVRTRATRAVRDFIAEFKESTMKAIKKNYRYMDYDEATINYLDDNNLETDPDKITRFEQKVDELTLRRTTKAANVLANILDVPRKDLL